MTRISRSGVSVDIPVGWEAEISGDGLRLQADGSREPTVLQAASFPLPPERGSFGAGAVETMTDQDIFITLFEYGPEAVGSALFARKGLPAELLSGDFDRDALQHGVPGQSGLQYFFTVSGRAFCLYVVLGSHIDRSELINQVNDVVSTIEIT